MNLNLCVDDLDHTVSMNGGNHTKISSAAELFSWRNARTTILLWMIWALVAVGYNLFNFLEPTLLLLSNGGHQTVQETYRDMILILSFGIPGSIIAALLSSSRSSQQWCMAASTLLLSTAVFGFGFLKSPLNQLIAACAIALLQNCMYGILYSLTPALFDSTCVRGTAMGIASALNSTLGCIAPLIGDKMEIWKQRDAGSEGG